MKLKIIIKKNVESIGYKYNFCVLFSMHRYIIPKCLKINLNNTLNFNFNYQQ